MFNFVRVLFTLEYYGTVIWYPKINQNKSVYKIISMFVHRIFLNVKHSRHDYYLLIQ